MKKNITAACIVFLALMLSCAGQKATGNNDVHGYAGTRGVSFKDSCEHLIVSMSLEVPMGEDNVSRQIRDSLIADFVFYARLMDDNLDGTSSIKPYRGDASDIQALVDHYGRVGYDMMYEQAMADYKDRTEYLDNDTTMTDEEREEIRAFVPQSCFDLNIKKDIDVADYVVYQSQLYVYQGGAHGGVIGSGALTFDKESGQMIDRFIRPEVCNAMQHLLRKGLKQYYGEFGEQMTDAELMDRLQIAGTTIPLPVRAAYPNAAGDSLTFTYGQYEIACYADGMPSFKLSTDEVAPYLTKEGKELLGKK